MSEVREEKSRSYYPYAVIGLSLIMLVFPETVSSDMSFRNAVSLLGIPLLFTGFGLLFEPAGDLKGLFYRLRSHFLRFLVPPAGMYAAIQLTQYCKNIRKADVLLTDHISRFTGFLLHPLSSETMQANAVTNILWVLTALFLIAVIYEILHFAGGDYAAFVFSGLIAVAGFVMVRRDIVPLFETDLACIGLLFYGCGALYKRTERLPTYYLWIILLTATVLFVFVRRGETMILEERFFPHKLILLKAAAGCIGITALLDLAEKLSGRAMKVLSLTGIAPVAFLCILSADSFFARWIYADDLYVSAFFRWLIVYAVSFAAAFTVHRLTDTVNEQETWIKEWYRKHRKVFNILFYILFAVCFIHQYLRTSMFTYLFAGSGSSLFTDIRRWSVVACIVLSSLTLVDIEKNSRLCIAVLVLVTGGLHYSFVGSLDYYVLCMLMAAISNRPFRPVLYISLIGGAAVLVSAFFASRAGYIYYLTYAEGRAFGMNYRTDLAAHIMFLMMICFSLRNTKLTVYEYGIWLLVIYFTWHYTAAKLTLVCMCLLFAGSLLLRLLSEKFSFHWQKKVCLVHAVMCAATFLLVFLYAKGYFNLNSPVFETLISRFRYSVYAFRNYPVRLLGTAITERGSGGLANYGKDYYYLDILYVRILFKFGIVPLLIYLYAMTKTTAGYISRNDHFAILIMILIALISMIEHHGLSLCYNVFILMTFCRPEKKKGGEAEV